MPKRTNDFQKLVRLIQQAFAPKGATVTESAMEPVPGFKNPREIDILVQTQVGPYRTRLLSRQLIQEGNSTMQHWGRSTANTLVTAQLR